ncbi:hypothetical protein [Sphingobacterium faecium]|uniref:hypothetical protein n=1 Tax=Sphingobacterium faecium TaxID=34087 RepID=UPI0024689C6E|nr:hypothetical protein [Sphingobacterium faecium]MDH5825807.1 hypothetical protein [Sphingobacterium faecium]
MSKIFKLHASSAVKIAGVKALGATGINFIYEWMKEKVYQKKSEFDSKYFEKGNFCEQPALDFSAAKLGFEHSFKNDEYFEDDYFCGTPDLILEQSNLIVDIKNSWDCFTFPLFEDDIPSKGYYYQLQVYMHLTGIHNSKLVYCLMDAPTDLINKETRRQAWAAGHMGFATEDLSAAVLDKMTYSNVNDDLRLKVFDVAFDPSAIAFLQQRVKECQEIVSNSKFFQTYYKS